MILGELSKGLMFSLFAVGDVCLTSWTRHSLAAEKENDVLFSAQMKTAKLRNAAPGSSRTITTGTEDVLIIPETNSIFGLRPDKTLNVTNTILGEKVENEQVNIWTGSCCLSSPASVECLEPLSYHRLQERGPC